VFEAEQALKRVEKLGDLFEPVLKLKQKLPRFTGIQQGTSAAIEAGVEISAQATPPALSRRKTVKACAQTEGARNRVAGHNVSV